MKLGFIPCDKVDNFLYEIDEECIADEKEQLAYLDLNKRYGFIGTFLYYNYEKFEADKFGEASIIKESKISKLYFDP